MRILDYGIILLIGSSFNVVANAQQLNDRKYVPPSSAATINKVIAGQGSVGADIVDPSLLNKGKDCVASVGSTTSQAGRSAPRQVVTVVKGDVINICK